MGGVFAIEVLVAVLTTGTGFLTSPDGLWVWLVCMVLVLNQIALVGKISQKQGCVEPRLHVSCGSEKSDLENCNTLQNKRDNP